MPKKKKKKGPIVPKKAIEVAEDIYRSRKGKAKRKQHIRRMKKIMKRIVITGNKEETEGKKTETEEESCDESIQTPAET